MRRAAYLFSSGTTGISTKLHSPSLSVLEKNQINSKMANTRAPQRKQSDEEESIPMLLLEGDKFCIGQDGICRTYYEIERWTASGSCLYQNEKQQRACLSLEETYDLNSARKTFQLRKKDPVSPLAQQDFTGMSLVTYNNWVVNVGKRVFQSIQLEEIEEGAFKSAGTGSIIWESSIAMSLYSSSNPDLLRGSILELGSGVGLGGMLLHQISKGNKKGISLTLSDGNMEVIDACRENCYHSNIPLHVKHLEWTESSTNPVETYDTILASDCAYKEEHIAPLAYTMKSRLKSDGRIHIFGPYNRATLHSLIDELRDRQNMDVQMHVIEMSRYRLTTNKSKEESKKSFVSRNIATFLHAIVSRSRNTTSPQSFALSSMHDID
mmetsp:Transcript_28742/g.43848  ORF Transcript_28742/g.43848 Transcript_28742/m.43848 type:complete len:380 (-) Transcript_28742:241-1380(-)